MSVGREVGMTWEDLEERNVSDQNIPCESLKPIKKVIRESR